MSAPDPVTVNVPLFRLEDPATPTAPTSASDHGEGKAALESDWMRANRKQRVKRKDPPEQCEVLAAMRIRVLIWNLLGF